jgi:nucleoside-diphosphate-sugar epimerase
MRLDVSVNMLTMQALSKGVITVFGGNQIRPNIHIEDITDLYIFLMEHPQHTGIFNAGFENLSILDIAKKITDHLPTEVKVTSSNDPRSYRINSDKILSLGFEPKKTVENAIEEIIKKFQNKDLVDSDHFYNLRWMEMKKLIHGIN